MKKCDEIQEKIIDEYYENKSDDITAEHMEGCSECMEFSNKLYAASQKLDILDQDDLAIPSDLFNIINKAEDIKEKRNKKFEICTFVFASLLILTPFTIVGLYLGVKFLLYVQVFLYINMPLILIPLIINKKMKEVD